MRSTGGAALALAADVLIVGESAFLQVGEVQQGMAVPYNVAWLRLRHSEAVAAQLTLVGRRYPGTELKELGLAYAAVPADAVLETAHNLAEKLAGYPAGSLSRIKAVLRRYNAQSADDWFDRAAQVTQASPMPSENPS